MRRVAALCLALCLLTAGCAPAAPLATPAEEGVGFTDALDREVTVDHPERVVALMGGFAEVWLLAGGALVGVSDDAVYERALDLPDDVRVVGTVTAPNLEEILALEPDLVLLSAETAEHVALREPLENAGVCAAYFSVNHFADYLGMLRQLCDITGREDAWEQYGLGVQREVDALLAGAAERMGARQPRVLLMITHSGGARLQTADSMTGRMLRELGCENLAELAPSLLREFGMEEIIAQDPDYIFVIAMGNSDELAQRHLEELVRDNPAWSSLSAVREGCFVTLPKELFLYKPNHRWAESYVRLLDLLCDEG